MAANEEFLYSLWHFKEKEKEQKYILWKQRSLI